MRSFRVVVERQRADPIAAEFLSVASSAIRLSAPFQPIIADHDRSAPSSLEAATSMSAYQLTAATSSNNPGLRLLPSPAPYSSMLISCSRCSVTVELTPSQGWRFTGGPCTELAGTQWADDPKWCPTLDNAMPDDAKLLSVGDRAKVETEIARMKARRGNKPPG